MSKFKFIISLGVSAGAVALACAGSANAGGFYLQEQSVKGLGRAYSGEASDTGADSLWWNPAAVANVKGIEVYGGVHAVFSDSELRDTGSTIRRPGQQTTSVGGEPRAYDPLETGVIPNSAAAWRVNEHIALGLAISAPFDFSTQYDSASFTRYQALTSKLLDLDIQPTVAIHINRYLDIGVGFDAQYAKSTLSYALPNLSPLLSDGVSRLEGDGWNYGWTVGAQLHPTERLTIGGSYRSQIDHELRGTVAITGLLGPLAPENGKTAASATFSTPSIAVLGARYVINDHWAVNGQAQRVGWGAFDAIRVRTAGGQIAFIQNYHDTTTGAIGVDYTVNPKWTLRSGIAYDPTPTPSEGRTSRVPDGDRWLLTIGTTVRPTPNLELDGALGYIHLQGSRVHSNANAYAGTQVSTPISYVAQVTGEAIIVSTGFKFHF
ncbi:MAG: outer membrane protein transport protein [Caulobacteraceae bacterium]|nr:outer membrane protein transport protein [Caulobacteraceae bacterium]